jgi:hypothetical protein
MIGAGQHLAAPQHAEFLLDHVPGDAEYHAGAATATIQAEHEARIVPRAPIDAGIEIEAAMVAMHGGQPAIRMDHHRIPDQRTIAKQPDIAVQAGCLGPGAERVAERTLHIGFWQQRGRDRRAAQ